MILYLKAKFKDGSCDICKRPFKQGEMFKQETKVVKGGATIVKTCEECMNSSDKDEIVRMEINNKKEKRVKEADEEVSQLKFYGME